MQLDFIKASCVICFVLQIVKGSAIAYTWSKLEFLAFEFVI